MRRTPSYFRAWWADRWPDVAMGTWYLFAAAVGLVGFFDPSLTLESALGVGALAFAAGMLLMGGFGFVSVVLDSRRSEATCLLVVSVLSVLHGTILILATPDGGGLQTGIRLISTPVAAIVLAHYRRTVGLIRRDPAATIAAQQAIAKHDGGAA